MTTKARFNAALANKKADRLPATTHHVQRFYLDKYEGGVTIPEFFARHGLDRIEWITPVRPDAAGGQYFSEPSTTGYQGIVTDTWRITAEEVAGQDYPTTRFTVSTPDGALSMIKQSNEYTSWVTEHLLKSKWDLEILLKHAPLPICDVAAANERALEVGEDALLRSSIPGFDIYGQPGCWQDAAVLYGIQELIMETFDDPEWVRSLLSFLQKRKLTFIRSMNGANIDLMELGGGDASTTVISPAIFNEFVAPFDAPLIRESHENGQRIVYHTCGGMMPILEDIVAMGPDAMETFTPPGMGGDVDLAAAAARIGDKLCFIGGLDQGRFLLYSTVEEIRAEVRRCFEAAGKEGGFIISPSDHFFDAKPELISAFAVAARECEY